MKNGSPVMSLTGMLLSVQGSNIAPGHVLGDWRCGSILEHIFVAIGL